MSFIKRLFGTEKEEITPNISFGRYSDIYKTPAQYKAWDESVLAFDRQAYLESYRLFFDYLNDAGTKSVKTEEKNGVMHFEITQGSKLVMGSISGEKISAQSKIALVHTPNVGFMRRLMEHNYNLKYTRFALDPENNITIHFNSYVVDGAPMKLYFALKELSINADKLDDLLLDEFKMLTHIEDVSVHTMSEQEREIKYRFMYRKIQTAFEIWKKGTPDPNQYAGAYAFLFLSLAYKLDYLLRPEGFMMDILEQVHHGYFVKDSKNSHVKILAICKLFQQLLDRPKADVYKQFYHTKSTFGVTTPVNHEKLGSFIDGELSKMDWYIQNKYHELALCIADFIVGFMFFNYALPKPDKAFLHLYYQITEPHYFKELGFSFNPREEDGRLNKKAILAKIKKITEANKSNFGKLEPQTQLLDFSELSRFAKSYLEMVKELNLFKTA